MAVSRHVDQQLKQLLVARLREQRAKGQLTSAQVRETAAALGIGERALWRWLGAETLSRRPRARYEVTQADRDAYWAWSGNVAAVRRERVAAGAVMPSLQSLYEAFARAITPAERAAVVDGVEGRRRHEVYLRWAPAARNALWETNHVELPVLVVPPPPARKPCKPWAMLFVDGFSRLPMGWALSLQPTAAVVLAALRQGIVIDPDRGPSAACPSAYAPITALSSLRRRSSARARRSGSSSAPLPPTRATRRARSSAGPPTRSSCPACLFTPAGHALPTGTSSAPAQPP